MASHHLLTCITLPILVTLLARICAADVSMYPFACSQDIRKCDALLHINSGLEKEQIASYYSVDPSTFRPISRGNNQDYLIPVPCSCEDIGNGTKGYFYDASYTVQENDMFADVSAHIYSRQALGVGGEEGNFNTGNKVSMHLLCGCLESQSEIIVTYTVQPGDVLSANINDVQSLNSNLTFDPDVIFTGWVLYVPIENDRIPAPKRGE
ncbi:hypothetical protein CRYUN_Cryun06bG0124700 [Craigia yunnanensis]